MSTVQLPLIYIYMPSRHGTLNFLTFVNPLYCLPIRAISLFSLPVFHYCCLEESLSHKKSRRKGEEGKGTQTLLVTSFPVPYSGKLLWEKTFESWWKLRFLRETLVDCSLVPPKDATRQNFAEKTSEFVKVFSSKNFPPYSTLICFCWVLISNHLTTKL